MNLPQSIHVHGTLSDSSRLSKFGYPEIGIENLTVVDCGNFYEKLSNNIGAIVDFQQSGSVSTSYVRTVANEGYLSSDYVSFVYKIKSGYAGKVYFSLRFGATAGFDGCSIKFYYSNLLVHQVVLSLNDILSLGGFNKFYYVCDNFTSFDSDVRDFKIEINGSSVILDCIIFNSSNIRELSDIQSYVVSENGSVFSLLANLDSNISLSDLNLKKLCDISSITLHLQLYTINNSNNQVSGFIKCHSYINTNSIEFDNGWLSFNLNYFYDYSSTEIEFIKNNYKIGISVIGCHKNENLYFIWSQSDSNSGEVYLLKKEDGLVESSIDLSVKVYDEIVTSEVSGLISTVPPSVESLFIQSFSNQEIVKSTNILIEKDNDGNEYVSLNLPNRIVTFIIDTSGSMTWNDSYNKRLDVAKKIIDRFAGGYPGGINYQIITFGGTQILTEWFGVVESSIDDTSDANEAKKAAFFDAAFKFNGVQVVRKKNSIPVSPTDGDIVYSGYSKVLYDTGLEENAIYFYAIFSQTDDGRFSEPVIIKVIPESRKIPNGIKSLDGVSFKASGVPVDSNIILSLHMDESSGKYIYDFSKGSICEYVKSGESSSIPVWIAKSESPAASDLENDGKGSGIRLNGINEYIKIYKNNLEDAQLSQIGFMIWIYPFSSNDNNLDFEMGLLNVSFKNSEILKIKIKTDLTIESLMGVNSVISGVKIKPNEWNHLAIFFNSTDTKICMNGELENLSGIYSESSISDIEIGRSDVDYGFFGKVTEFSLHNSDRQYDYIKYHYQNIASWNGDSIVVLNFNVPQSYIDSNIRYSIRYKPEIGPLRHISEDINGPANFGNYSADSGFRPPNVPPNWTPRTTSFSRLAYGDDLGPSNGEDGEELFSGVIDSSSYIFVVNKKYVSNFDEIEKTGLGASFPGFRHFFRIFTINNDDVYSLPEESGLFEYTPPIYRNRLDAPASINSVKNVEYYAGNSKVYLKWDLDYDPNISNVVIYFSRIGYPDIIAMRGGEDESSYPLDIFPVFIGDSDSKDFVFRKGIVEYSKSSSLVSNPGFGSFGSSRCPECDLLNNENAYFSIYTRDKYGNYSNPVNVLVVPGENKDDEFIPPDKIFGLRYQPVDSNSVSIRWVNPGKINSFSDISCWTDDRIVFYFKATDIFGRKLNSKYKFKFSTSRSSDPLQIDDGFPGQVFLVGGIGDGNNSWGWYNFYNESYPRGFSEGLQNETHFDPDRQLGLRAKLYFSKMAKVQEVFDNSDGYTKIFFDLSNASLDELSLTSQVYFSASVSLKISKNISLDLVAENVDSSIFDDSLDYFEYTTSPIRVLMNNPLAVMIHTSTEVKYPNPVNIGIQSFSGNVCDYSTYGIGGNGSFEESGIQVSGCYVSRSSPYAILIRASYKGKPLYENFKANIYIYDDVDPPNLIEDVDNRAIEPFRSLSVWGEICGAVAYCTQEDPLPADPFAGTYKLSSIGIQQNQVTFNPNVSNRFSEAIYYLPVPSDPISIRVIFKIEIDGIFACPQAYLSFVNNLRLRINTRGPISDGKDVAKQICYAYTIDPDFSVNTSSETGLIEDFIRPVPDFTPVLWELFKFRNAKERPFYSVSQRQNNSNLVLAEGVYDYFVDGYSQNVYFGPAANVSGQLVLNNGSIEFIGEEYVVKATITYNGYTVSAFGPACIFPLNYNEESDNPEIPSLKKTSMFVSMESGNFVETLYSDGKDFTTIIISRDPEISYQESSGLLNSTVSNYLKCYNSNLFPDSSGISGAFISKLPKDKSIYFEIIKLKSYHNNDLPYWTSSIKIEHGNLSIFQENEILMARGDFSDNDGANIKTEDTNNTRIALSCNSFIPLIWSRYGDPTTVKDIGVLCSHIHNNPNGAAGSINPYANFLDYDISIRAKTNLLINGVDNEVISSGAWSTGNPPKFIKFVEPLRIDLAYVLVNGQPSNTIRVDGVSSNKLVYVVTFAGRKIAIDSPIKVYQCDINILKAEQEIVYCEIKEDPFFVGLDLSGNLIPGYIPGSQSFFYLDLEVLDPSQTFSGTIFAECNYDESGDIIRQRVFGAKINYEPTGLYLNNFGYNKNEIIYSSSSSSSSSMAQVDIDDNLYYFANQLSNNYDVQYKSTSSSSSSIYIPNLEEDLLYSRPKTTTPFSKNCYVYDLSLEGQSSVSPWYRIADMAIERAWHSIEYVGSRAYAIGGVSIGGITSYNECWDPQINQWVYRKPMISPRFGMQTCNDGRYIYCIGGIELGNIYGSGGGGSQGGASGSSSSSSGVIKKSPVVSVKVERYDTQTDTWSSLKSMPILDVNQNDISNTVISEYQDIIKYGVAYGGAIIEDNKIIIYCGVNYIHPVTYEPTRMNDRILTYNISNNTWSYSNLVLEEKRSLYSRIYPSSFKGNSNNIVVFGGTKYEISNTDIYASGLGGVINTPFTSREIGTDCFKLDVLEIISNFGSSFNFSIFDSSYLFNNLPLPRDRSGLVVLNDDVYVLGGRIFPNDNYPGTSFSRKFEKLSLNGVGYVLEKLEKPPQGRSVFGMFTDGVSKIFACGGLVSQVAPGYVQLDIKAYGEQTERNESGFNSIYEQADAVIRLDGRSHCDLVIYAYDEEGDLIEKPIEIDIYGSIKFPSENGSEDFESGPAFGSFGGSQASGNKKIKRRGTRVYPVQIEPSKVFTSSGKAFARVLPRTEDPLRTISEINSILNLDINQRQAGYQSNFIKIIQNSARFPYQIIISAQILDDFYFGTTSYSSNASSSSSSEYVFFPELFEPDINADAGEFDLAKSLPSFKVVNTDVSATLPTYFHDSGYILMTQQIGFIGGVDDSDLFTVLAPKTGSYKISVTNKGFSELKAKVKIFKSDKSPYILCESSQSNILVFSNSFGVPSFESPGCLSDGGGYSVDLNDELYLVAGFRYYIEVSAVGTDSADLVNRVGEYRLRLGVNLSLEELDYYIATYNSASESGAFNSSSSSGLQLRSTFLPPVCPFRCQECVSDDSRWARVTCIGSDNTYCIQVPVDSYSPPPSFNAGFNQNNYFIPDPYGLPDPQPPISIPEYLQAEFIDLDESILSGQSGFVQIDVNESPVIQYYSDFDWIPEIKELLPINIGSYDNAISIIDNIKNSTNFGCSPLYDAMEYAVNSYFKEDLDPYFPASLKSIYVFTDNDENTSDSNPDDVADLINSVNGYGNTPIVIYNFNLTKPITIANEASLVNTGLIARIIKQTNGEIINYIDSLFEDSYVDFGVGESIGSVGLGEYHIYVNFSSEVWFKNIIHEYEIPNYTNILWGLEYSEDGQNYIKNDIYYSISDFSHIFNKQFKYIKLKYKFIHNFKDSYIDPYTGDIVAERPKLLGISLQYSYPRENLIVLNEFDIGSDLQQISISIVSEDDDFSKIYIGASSRGSSDWSNYFKDSQPFIRNNEKIFIPYRVSDPAEVIIEPLNRIDEFSFVAEHGGWMIDSAVSILDKNGDLVDDKKYKSFSHSGTVVFNEPTSSSDYKIMIKNTSSCVIAINCINYSPDHSAKIKAITLFANSNIEQRYLNENSKPIAYNLSFTLNSYSPYTPVSVLYSYADLDGDEEDKTKTLIQWYKNGILVPELNNQKSLNDLNNPDDITYQFVFSQEYWRQQQETGRPAEILASLRGERLWSAGDNIYFTVTPHDGNQYGNVSISETITIVDIADRPSYLLIRGRLDIGGTSLPDSDPGDGSSSGGTPNFRLTNLFNKRAVLFADYDIFSFSKMQTTTIRWYVNGSLWKSGPLIADPGFSSFATYEIIPFEENPLFPVPGKVANTIGNIIEVELLLQDGFSIKSNPIQIVNCIPRIPSVQIVKVTGINPASGSTTEIIKIDNYLIDDPDIEYANQSDQSIIRWYFSIDDGINWEYYPRAQPKNDLGPNEHSPGQKWKIIVTPYDGFQQGDNVESNIIQILQD